MAGTIDIGLSDSARATIADGLSRVLAESFTLYLKTHKFHWNVTGRMFQALHNLFQAQYTELATAVDEVAEHIRSLGLTAPGSYAEFSRLSAISDQQGNPAAEAMIAELVEDQYTLIKTCREVLPTAQEYGDEATADLLIARMRVHQKAAWMLRSILETS